MAELDDGLFLIDGEGAGSTPWEFDSLVENAGNSITLDVAAKNNGTYGYKFNFGGTVSSYNNYGIKGIAEQSEIYSRTYVYIPTGTDVGTQYNTIGIMYFVNNGSTVCYIAMYGQNGSTADRWYIRGPDITETIVNTNFSTNTWHYIEMRFKRGTSGDGIIQVWVDGDLIFNNTSVTHTGGLDYVDQVDLGAHETWGEPTAYYYQDDCKADNSPVGVYSDAGGGIVVLRRRRM